MSTIKVAALADFDGDRIIVSVEDREVGIFKTPYGLVGWLNVCPHQGGPVCQGRFYKRVIEVSDPQMRFVRRDYDEKTTHLVCPWHGAEFNIRTGRHAGTATLELQPVDVFVKNGDIYVRLP